MPRKKIEPIVGNKKLQDYELIFILNPDMAEEAIDSKIDSIGQFITTREGVITDTQKWGKKKLSYPVKHFLEGNYTLVKFQAKPARAKELETSLRISEEIIRHLLVKAGE